MVLQVLNTCQEVVNQSNDVKIISSNIPKLAAKVIKKIYIFLLYF